MKTEVFIKQNVISIIIFFIFVIIVLCSFTGIFETKSKKSFKSDTKKLINLVTENCESERLNGLPHTSNYSIKQGELTPKLELDIDKNLNGNISINTECKITLIVYNDNYVIKKDFNSSSYISKKNQKNQCILQDKKLEIGSTVRCGKDDFNIINYTDTTITLFSKYNIDIKSNKQDPNDNTINSINAVSFDKINNRINANNTYCQKTQYGCNIYEKKDGVFSNGIFIGTITEDSTIKSYVDSYSIMLNLQDDLLSAGLISKKELIDLGCSDITNNCNQSKYNWLYNSTYWTSTYFEGSPSIVYRVTTEGVIGTGYANYDNFTGIRPAITIGIDSLKIK